MSTRRNEAIGFDRGLLARCGWLRTIEVHDSIGSTNDRAKQLAADGVEAPALVVARRQTAGRGRGDRTWWSGDGALTSSLLLPRGSASRHGLLSVAVALAVADSVEALAGLTTGYKWPNDVWIDGRKLAGILIESTPGGLIVGVGANVANSLREAPASIRETATALIDEVAPPQQSGPTPQALLLRFLEVAPDWFAAATDDPLRVIAAARARCVLTGRRVTVTDGDRETTGPCDGLDDDGALLIDTGGSEPTRVVSGSVTRIE